jgi:LysM repeat protein
MKVNSQFIYRFGLIAILVIGLCAGCASLDQKIKDSGWTEKMERWNEALKKKFGIGDKNWEYENEDNSSYASSGFYIHKVQRRGETFNTISLWYTGNPENEKALASYNPKIDPNRIKIGSQVKIPEDLVDTLDPMSPAFIDKHLPDYHEHNIRWPGETLSLISKWYTGRYTNWKKLAYHNPEINPNRINIGQKIYIPVTLLKTREPLPEKFAAKRLPSYFAYTVQRPGERLSEIAGWFTGDSKNWKSIARANPDLDPESLLIGNEIYIPPKLLKTRDPIPQGSRNSRNISGQNKENEAPQNETAPQREENEIQLFGPKKFPKG